jgi:hypothetical protein
MPNENMDDHDTLITLVEQVRQLTQAVEKMEKALNNLRESFVTRDEFSNVKIAVMGVANDGGLMARVSSLEETKAEQKGSWSTVQVAWTVGIAIVGILIAIYVK